VPIGHLGTRPQWEAPITTIILARHAQSIHHVTDLTGGWTDTGLTERGRRQAACLAERLQHELDGRACRFVCSELARATQTAQAIADATGLAPTFDAGLKEYNNGLAAGKTWQEASQMMAAQTEPILDWRPYPQAETRREFHQRVVACLERMTADSTLLLLVTHGGTIIHIVSWWLGLEVDQTSQVSFAVAPASLSVLTINGWRNHTLERLNDTAHLQAMGLTYPC
jgi:probable phosphoglycerate mutase